MQDTKDPRAFTIVERYAHESVSSCPSNPSMLLPHGKARSYDRVYCLEIRVML